LEQGIWSLAVLDVYCRARLGRRGKSLVSQEKQA
jgi:hypothetical protein